MMSAKLKTYIGLILLFIFGMITGIAFSVIVGKTIIKRSIVNPAKGRQMIVRKLDRALNLSNEQTIQIKLILEDGHRGLFEIREEMMPKVIRVIDEAKDEIIQILDDEQKVKFEKMYSGAMSTWEDIRERQSLGFSNSGRIRIYEQKPFQP